MSLCKAGHDLDEAGRDKNGRCSECRRIENRARMRRARAGQPKLPGPDRCVNDHPKDGPGPCRECRSIRNKRYRNTPEFREARNAKDRAKYAKPAPVDGWEDEFGLCPEPRPGRSWVDRVALERRLAGAEIGRDLTTGEARALVLLDAIREGREHGGYEPHRARLIFADGRRF